MMMGNFKELFGFAKSRLNAFGMPVTEQTIDDMVAAPDTFVDDVCKLDERLAW